MNALLAEKLPHTFSYEHYQSLMEQLVADGKTTGPKQSEEMAHYTFLNHRRMRRLDKTVKIEPALLKQLLALKKKYLWIVITEVIWM